MTDEKSFEILHFSTKYPRNICKPPQYPYFVHNLVWRAIDPDFKEYCLNWVKDWIKIRVTFNTELADEYFNGLSYSFGEFDNQFDGHPVKIEQRDGLRRDFVFQDAWQSQFPFVIYLEKFDCFRAWGYTESNAITQACIHEIEMLKLNERMYTGRFATWCHFRRVIETLDRFWD